MIFSIFSILSLLYYVSHIFLNLNLFSISGYEILNNFIDLDLTTNNKNIIKNSFSAYLKKINPIKIFTELHIKANLKVCRDQLKGKSGIYGIINLHENKLYIGQSINIFNRFKQHIKKSSNSPLYNAMKKNGLHNFAFVVFVFVQSHSVENNFKKELSNVEAKYIKSFNPKFLYNIILYSSRGNNKIICTKNNNLVINNLVLPDINININININNNINKNRTKLSIYQFIKKFLIFVLKLIFLSS
jgi:GIY-YIG catalytic domain